ncbi:hypothetical protein FA95DRAFT_1576600 [Auriscalpium vulgare]|uniref:Uncharacterized protein n=1 Tax=Auriscalpium vulgare TaxID=40419 RepID=A0ACB8RAI9_9AGAM|nr:hypothetical protein FA95DRAFT_1576600 [Auriscalpium vulgare]
MEGYAPYLAMMAHQYWGQDTVFWSPEAAADATAIHANTAGAGFDVTVRSQPIQRDDYTFDFEPSFNFSEADYNQTPSPSYEVWSDTGDTFPGKRGTEVQRLADAGAQSQISGSSMSGWPYIAPESTYSSLAGWNAALWQHETHMDDKMGLAHANPWVPDEIDERHRSLESTLKSEQEVKLRLRWEEPITVPLTKEKQEGHDKIAPSTGKKRARTSNVATKSLKKATGAARPKTPTLARIFSKSKKAAATHGAVNAVKKEITRHKIEKELHLYKATKFTNDSSGTTTISKNIWPGNTTGATAAA